MLDFFTELNDLPYIFKTGLATLVKTSRLGTSGLRCTACAHEQTRWKKVQQCKSASDLKLSLRYQTNEKLAAHLRRYDTALLCKAG